LKSSRVLCPAQAWSVPPHLARIQPRPLLRPPHALHPQDPLPIQIPILPTASAVAQRLRRPRHVPAVLCVVAVILRDAARRPALSQKRQFPTCQGCCGNLPGADRIPVSIARSSRSSRAVDYGSRDRLILLILPRCFETQTA